MAEQRPKWVDRLWRFLGDDILDYDFPDDGSDDALLEEIEDTVNAILCRQYGHNIIDDMCGIPEHRYCVYCRKSVVTIVVTIPDGDVQELIDAGLIEFVPDEVDEAQHG